ncbi:hypothetical protein NDU88_007527 [Pleurodeles waltl]|uniref:Uncharacterized protein n=1 Tax=Pleurodeles waltl TaxID=8319 RepID=A0AAV7N2G4_PLEWA|nr:hypothetical protein NDU88_007527 [Pleurodeles waltl]
MPCRKAAEFSLKNDKRKIAQPKKKGIVRWHRAVSTNLSNPNLLLPKDDSSSENDFETFDIQEEKKNNFVKKMKTSLGKIFPSNKRENKCMQLQDTKPLCPAETKGTLISSTQGLLPRIIKDLPSPKVLPKLKSWRVSQNATIQLNVNVIEAESERITHNNVIVRSRRMSRRVSVTSVPTGLQKIPYQPKKKHFRGVKKKNKKVDNSRRHSDLTIGNLQMQVDELIDTVAEKSTKLLAQRQAELLKCECLGDEIAQTSKQFERVSKRSTRKYRLKSMCFPCACCC